MVSFVIYAVLSHAKFASCISGIRYLVSGAGKKVLGVRRVGEEKLHSPEIKAILQPANFCLTSPAIGRDDEQDSTSGRSPCWQCCWSHWKWLRWCWKARWKTFSSENSLGQKFAHTKRERFSHNSLLRTKCKVFNGKPGFNVQLSLCYNFFMEEVSHYKM